MVKKCIVCKKTYVKGCILSFHQVPLDMERRLKWSFSLGIEFPQTGFTHVCSDHFSENDFTIGKVTKQSGETLCRRQLSASAIPKLQDSAVEERPGCSYSPKKLSTSDEETDTASMCSEISGIEALPDTVIEGMEKVARKYINVATTISSSTLTASEQSFGSQLEQG